jgi:hypothetical protein
MAPKRGYTLYQLHADGETRTLVSKHASLAGGFSAGQEAVHDDKVHAFALYGPEGRRAATFAKSRLEQRLDSFASVDLSSALLELGS